MLNSKYNRIWIDSILAIASLLIVFFGFSATKAYAADTLVYSTYSASNNGSSNNHFHYNDQNQNSRATYFANCYENLTTTEINKAQFILYNGTTTPGVYFPSDFSIQVNEVSSCSSISILGDLVSEAEPTVFSTAATTTVTALFTQPFSMATSTKYLVQLRYNGIVNPPTSSAHAITRTYTDTNANAVQWRYSKQTNTWTQNTSGSLMFFNFYNDTDWTDPQLPQAINYSPNYNTRFTDISYTLSSTTLSLVPEYFIDLDEIDLTVPNRNITDVQVRWSLRPTTDVSERSYSVLPLSAGSQSTTIEADGITDGTYDFYVGFFNLGTVFDEEKRPFKETNIQFSITVSGGVITASSTTELYDGLATDNPENIVCSLQSLDGCFTKAIMFLMIPGDYGMSYLDEVYAEMGTRFPFAYMTDFKDSITSVYTNPTTQSLGLVVPFASYGDITIISGAMVSDFPLSAPIKSLLSALLWVMLVVQMWRRSQRIFNPAHI